MDGPYQKLSAYDGLEQAPHFNVGLDDPEFRNFAGIYSDAIFDVFYQFARTNLKKGQPLVIARWVRSELRLEHQVEGDRPLLRGVRTPGRQRFRIRHWHGDRCPVPLHRQSEDRLGRLLRPRVSERTARSISGRYDIYETDHDKIADMLANDLILGWVSGRYEIGPRALGNRSILAAPFRDSTRVRLNEIKQREQFRPIAPVCLQDDAEKWFGCDHESPYMLYTYRSTTDALAAVTHVNGTARIQTVTSATNRASLRPARRIQEHAPVTEFCATPL